MNLPPMLDRVGRSEPRRLVLISLHQPMTASQLSRRLDISQECCSRVLSELVSLGLVDCFSETSRRSRLYGLTELGRACQQHQRELLGLPAVKYVGPEVDWNQYAWLCFRHRSAVIKAIRCPMAAAAVKRRAVMEDPTLRMSANNVRDVMRLLVQRKLVRRVQPRGKAHPCYELTPMGTRLRELLLRAEGPI